VSILCHTLGYLVPEPLTAGGKSRPVPAVAYTQSVETDLLDPVLQADRSPLDTRALELLTATLDREGVMAAAVYVQEPDQEAEHQRRLLSPLLERPASRLSQLNVAVFTDPAVDHPAVLYADLEGAVRRALRAAGVSIAVYLMTPGADAIHVGAVAMMRRAGVLLVDRETVAA
jgi:hypothetical protein